MKLSKRLTAVILAAACVFGTVNISAGAAENSSEKAFYSFSGENADRSGYAQGTVTFPSEKGTEYTLYWADDDGILDDYEPIATVKASGTQTEFSFERAVAIPEGATKLAVFLKSGSLSLSGAKYVIDIPEEKRAKQDTVFSFASVSDVHVNYDSENLNASGKWTAALNYFDSLGLDYVIVSGDMTSNATTDEFEKYKAATEASSYDKERIYEARGNHESQNNANFIKYTSGKAQAGEVRPYEDSPYFYRLFKGENGAKDNLLIFMAQELTSTGNSSNQDNWSKTQINWVEGLLKDFAGTNTNIFLVQHTVFRNFGPGDRIDGAYSQPTHLTEKFPQNFRLKKLLREYKEIIQMSGHTHLSFYENLNFGDENGTAARMIHNSSTSQPRSYTSSGSISYNSEGKTNASYGSECYAVNVTSSDIVYYGTNLSTKKRIPTACFIMESYGENRADAQRIEIAKGPDKSKYYAGEKFDPAGLRVIAYYQEGNSTEVKGYYVDTDSELSIGTESVTVRYGELTAEVPIEVIKMFDGDGTKTSPYLISTPDDFNRLTEFFNASVGTDSHDKTTFGAGVYFKQTADIDMTGYEGYKGTVATGSLKCGFSGVYDGAGHTLTVDIENNAIEVSVFPYFNGLLLNLNIAGTVTNTSTDSAASAQTIRTLGKNGAVINCTSSVAFKANCARGLTYTLYGYVDRFVYNGNRDGVKNSFYPITATISNGGVTGTIAGAYYNTDVKATYGTAFTDITKPLETLHKAPVSKTLSKIRSYIAGYKAESLAEWCVRGNTAVLISGEHMWEDDYTIDASATCETAGSASIHCKLCGAKSDIKTIDPIGHNYVKMAVKDPTYTQEGAVTYVCKNDSSHTYSEVIPKLSPINADKLSIGKNFTLTVGKSKTLKAVISPDNVTDKNVTWSSSDKKVADIKNGKVIAKLPGSAKITARAGGKTAAITVTVLPKAVKKFTVSKKGKKITVTVKKSDKRCGAYIEYRKFGAKAYKRLALIKGAKFSKKLSSGKYQIRVCACAKNGGRLYKSVYTKAKTVTIR